MTQLSSLPHIYAKEKRISLHGAFPELATPYPGTSNQPYDTMYRALKRIAAQRPDAIREILRKSLPKHLSWTNKERTANRAKYGAGEAPEVYSAFVDSLARFIIGIAGGCVLIIPMVIMVLGPSLTKSLIVTSIAVVIFALAVSLIFEADNTSTVTVTAAYAAVLVVFVGSNSSGS